MSPSKPLETSDISEEEWDWLYLDSPTPNDSKHGSIPQSQRESRRQPTRTVVGARLGLETYYRGDCVLLRAEGSNQCWVAIIQDFTIDDEGRKAAEFVWFSNEKEIANKAKKRMDALPVGCLAC